MRKSGIYRFMLAALVSVCLVLCTGCGEKEEFEPVVPSRLQDQEGQGEENGQQNAQAMENGGQQNAGGSQDDSQQAAASKVPLSYEKETVVYEGTFPEKQVFAAGGSSIYMVGSTGDASRLYVMEEGAAVFEESDMVFPENMLVKKLAVDEEGNCHILLLSVGTGQVGGASVTMVTGEAMEIWVAGRDGALLKTIRASEEVKGLNPYSFVIGADGRYYMDDAGQNVYVVDQNGGLTAEVTLPKVEGMGMGADGRLYVTAETLGGAALYYLEQAGEAWEAVLSDCTLPAAQSQYSDIGAGREDEVWIFSKTGGILIYYSNSGMLKQALTNEEYPCSAQELIGYGMLADGRMVCVCKEGENTVFVYLPFYDEDH